MECSDLSRSDDRWQGERLRCRHSVFHYQYTQEGSHHTVFGPNTSVVLWQLHRHIQEGTVVILRMIERGRDSGERTQRFIDGLNLAWKLPMILFRAIRRMGLARQRGASPGELAPNTGVVLPRLE